LQSLNKNWKTQHSQLVHMFLLTAGFVFNPHFKFICRCIFKGCFAGKRTLAVKNKETARFRGRASSVLLAITSLTHLRWFLWLGERKVFLELFRESKRFLAEFSCEEILILYLVSDKYDVWWIEFASAVWTS
jgi:hypothetical protein